MSEPLSLSASVGEPHRDTRPERGREPTRNAFQELWVANAAANTGASVDTEPSINPAKPGCTIRSTKLRRAASVSSSRCLSVRVSRTSLPATLSCSTSASARSPSTRRICASVVRVAARR